MIPRTEVDGIDLNEPIEEAIRTMQNSQYTRLPVFEDSIDNIIGVIHIRKAIIALAQGKLTKETIRDICAPPYFVPEGTPLNMQLLNFQRQKKRMGLVVDEYGDFLGLITLADLLEEIVGEFVTDPSDSVKDVQPQDDGSYLVTGSANVKELVKNMHWELPINGPRTINGLILEYLETIPVPGTSLLLEGYPVEILQTQDNVVRMVRIHPQQKREI